MPPETMNQTFERIAREELSLTTLEPRHNDEEDFHRLAVWEIQTVMERAYQAGFHAAASAKYIRSWFSVGETLHDGSTQTIDTFDTLQDALRFAAKLNKPCFIDRWQSASPTPSESIDEIDETFTPVHYPF